MIEELIKELTSSIRELNSTLKQQARSSEPEPEKHEHKTTPKQKTSTAPIEPETAPSQGPASVPTDPLESRHKALQSLCLQIVRADPAQKARLKSILAEYGATIVADISEQHIAEAERRIQDLA